MCSGVCFRCCVLHIADVVVIHLDVAIVHLNVAVVHVDFATVNLDVAVIHLVVATVHLDVAIVHRHIAYVAITIQNVSGVCYICCNNRPHQHPSRCPGASTTDICSSCMSW